MVCAFALLAREFLFKLLTEILYELGTMRVILSSAVANSCCLALVSNATARVLSSRWCFKRFPVLLFLRAASELCLLSLALRVLSHVWTTMVAELARSAQRRLNGWFSCTNWKKDSFSKAALLDSSCGGAFPCGTPAAVHLKF